MTNKKIIFGIVALMCMAVVGVFLTSNSIGTDYNIPEEKRRCYIDSISLNPGNYSTVNGNNVRGEVFFYLSYLCPYYGLKSYDDIKWYIDNEYVGSSFPVRWDTTKYEDGTHKIRVEATNTVGYTAKKEISVDVDNSGPWFKIINPKDGEEVEGLFYPEVEVDEEIEWNDIEWFLSNGSWTRKVGTTIKTILGHYGGNYSLIVRVRDNLGNVKNDSIHIIIKSPELYINPDDVQITPYPPKVGENATIRVKVYNNGEVDSEEFYVVFAYGKKRYVDVTVDKITVDSLPVNDSKILSVNFVPVKDVDAIMVIVDRGDWIHESNEEDNSIYMEFDERKGRYVVIDNG